MKTKLVTLLNPTSDQLDHYHGDGNIEDVLTVIFKSNADGTVTISSDLQTTCKRAETAINRYFRAIPENHPLRTYWGNEIADIDAIKESLNETGEFTMHDDEYQIYSVGVELNTIDDDDRSYYVWLNYRTTKEQLKTDFPEIMEELEPSSEAESEEVEAEEVKSTPTQEQIVSIIEATKTRSQWDKGVKQYAIELVEQFFPEEFEEKNWDTPQQIKSNLLNNASDWKEYSYGGIPLAYDREIAQRLATPTELKLTEGGSKNPNKYENWLDVQARALYQACNLVVQSIEKVGE